MDISLLQLFPLRVTELTKQMATRTETKSFFPLRVLHGCCHAGVMEKNDGSSCNSASYRSNLVTQGQFNWSHYVSRKFSLWNFSFFFIWLELLIIMHFNKWLYKNNSYCLHKSNKPSFIYYTIMIVWPVQALLWATQALECSC